MSDLSMRQQQCIKALASILDRCHRNGLVLRVMDGSVYLGTDARFDHNGCLVQDDHHMVKTEIDADGGGW